MANFCSSCGQKSSEEAFFCTMCGCELRKKPVSQEQANPVPMKQPKLLSFKDFVSKKEKDRTGLSVKKSSGTSLKRIFCSVAWCGKPQASSKLQVELPENADYGAILTQCYDKQAQFNSHIVTHPICQYDITFKSGKVAKTIPGGQKPFRLQDYKDSIGLPYGSLHFVLNWKGDDDEEFSDSSLPDVSVINAAPTDRFDSDIEEVCQPANSITSLQSVPSCSSAPDQPSCSSAPHQPSCSSARHTLSNAGPSYQSDADETDSDSWTCDQVFPLLHTDDSIDDDMFQAAVANSLQEQTRSEPITNIDEITGVLQAFGDEVVGKDVRQIVISRRKVWESTKNGFRLSTIRRRNALFVVKFQGDLSETVEPSADLGGPRREWFRLLLQEIKSSSGLFTTDSDGTVNIRRNIKALSHNEYELVGELLATMVAQGGPAPQLFTDGVVSYICTLSTEVFGLADIAQPLSSALQAVQDSKTEADIQVAISNEALEVVDGLPATVTLSNKAEYVKLYIRHCFVEVKPYIDQLMVGLNHYAFLDMVRKNRLQEILRQRSQPPELSAVDLLRCVKPQYSQRQQLREREESVMTNLEYAVHMIEEGTLTDVLSSDDVFTVDGITHRPREHETLAETVRKFKPRHILAFITGADKRPAAGWITKPTIAFQHGATSSMMFASTCSLTLTIPVTESNQNLNGFLFMFAVALCQGGTFSAV